MLINKRLKFRIYPDNQQIKLINQTCGNARFVYNYFLNLKSEQSKRNKLKTKEDREKQYSTIDMINLLPELKNTIFSLEKDDSNKNLLLNYKQTFWLKDSLSSALQQSMKQERVVRVGHYSALIFKRQVYI